jgi:hypothetical protein
MFFKNTTELASSTQLNLQEQKQHAVPKAFGSIRPLKNNFVRMKKTYLFLLFSIFFVSACLKKEDLNDSWSETSINPEYSLPIGTVGYSMDTAFAIPGYILPYPNTTAYYENKPYGVPLFFEQNNFSDFSLNVGTRFCDRIESYKFHTVITNYFPTRVIAQIYLLNEYKVILDSLSSTGPVLLDAAPTDKNGKVTNGLTQVYYFPFTDQQLINNAAYYCIKTKIETQKQGVDTVHFFNNNKIEIIIGLQLKMKLKITDI